MNSAERDKLIQETSISPYTSPAASATKRNHGNTAAVAVAADFNSAAVQSPEARAVLEEVAALTADVTSLSSAQKRLIDERERKRREEKR